MGKKLLPASLMQYRWNSGSYLITQTYDLLIESIVVLYNAGPLDISWAINSDKVVAILESFFPAQVSLTQ